MASGDEVADHQVIIRGGQVEAVVVPLEEYRALKALEQRRQNAECGAAQMRQVKHAIAGALRDLHRPLRLSQDAARLEEKKRTGPGELNLMLAALE